MSSKSDAEVRMNAIKSIAETKLIKILGDQEAKTPAIVSVLAGGIAGAIEAASTVIKAITIPAPR